MNKISMNGRGYWRALAYAVKICPPADSASRLAHVVFIGNKIVCSDGVRWHAGIIPETMPHPLVVVKDSASELLLGLEYADKIARRHGGNFFVTQNGLDVEIHYADKKISHKLIDAKVGHVPAEWDPPVPSDAPTLVDMPEVHAGHIKDAVSWYRSWEKDHGQVRMRGRGGQHPARYEIVVDDEVVVFAILLPVKHQAAQLPLDEPLFAGGRQTGQSILDLSFDLPPPAPPKVIKIGDVEINVTGLDNSDDLIKHGPCKHRDEADPCVPCTRAAVKEEQKKLAEKVVSIKDAAPPKKRAGKGKKNGKPEADPPVA